LLTRVESTFDYQPQPLVSEYMKVL